MSRASAMSEPSFGVCLASGMFASLAVDLPLYPIDTLRTRLQAPNGLFANGGLRGIWSGYSTVLLMAMPTSGLFFVAYDTTQRYLQRRAPTVPALAIDASAASLAEILVCAVSVPSEIVKQKMQTQRGCNPVMDSCNGAAERNMARRSSQAPCICRTIHTLAQQQGLAGFYRGLGAQLCREVPFGVMQMSLFEALKRRHPMANKGTDTSSCFVGMTCGGVSGAIAGAVTTPLDLAKTRIQLRTSSTAHSSMLAEIVDIHRTSGAASLFKGVVPRTVYCGIGGALWLGAFEWAKHRLRSAEEVL
eukprot:TRINITY_DN18029_c0_g4_i1.p1 TRINITY_DN18029_c0_g4~~TRINITY_DN18029_c0_g4_i1.p1  ORF type:complete len:303 (+),score=22.19 TRINITY_DN18029_c0_g4_i1:57-965(+)